MRLLDQDGLEGLEVVTFPHAVNGHILLDFANEEIFNATVVAVQVTVEEELVQVELSSELAVDAVQDVHLKLLRDPLGIVVGHLDGPIVLLQVEGNHQ